MTECFPETQCAGPPKKKGAVLAWGAYDDVET